MIENLDKNKIQIGEKCDISDTIIFSDHVKIGNNCKVDDKINLNNVNSIRLILSCITGNRFNYID